MQRGSGCWVERGLELGVPHWYLSWSARGKLSIFQLPCVAQTFWSGVNGVNWTLQTSTISQGTQQYRPELPPLTITWHRSKKEDKLNQGRILPFWNLGLTGWPNIIEGKSHQRAVPTLQTYMHTEKLELLSFVEFSLTISPIQFGMLCSLFTISGQPLPAWCNWPPPYCPQHG